MALGRQSERRAGLKVCWAELPRSPWHVFYAQLQAVLVEAGFDDFAEQQCAPHYASRRGEPSLPLSRYFGTHLVGYVEGIDSERDLEWRCSDNLSLREFLQLGLSEQVPDHSWLSETRARLPLEVDEAIFSRVLRRLAEHGLIQGDRIGVDAFRGGRSQSDGGQRRPTAADLAELVADKGYYSCAGLTELKDGAWKSRIAERKVRGVHRWHGDKKTRRAVYNNRAQLR